MSYLLTYREINEYSLNKFQSNLSHETWEKVLNNSDIDINTIYNNFLGTFLKIFNASFPVKRTQSKQCDNNWITTGIRTSCNNKRKLYLLYKENNNPKFKKHYKEYCKLLTKVIILAKKSYYNTKLINSANKTKTTWNIKTRIIRENRIICCWWK